MTTIGSDPLHVFYLLRKLCLVYFLSLFEVFSSLETGAKFLCGTQGDILHWSASDWIYEAGYSSLVTLQGPVLLFSCIYCNCRIHIYALFTIIYFATLL